MLIGFVCRDEAEWVDLRRRVGQVSFRVVCVVFYASSHPVPFRPSLRPFDVTSSSSRPSASFVSSPASSYRKLGTDKALPQLPRTIFSIQASRRDGPGEHLGSGGPRGS
ncbi:hypothetical protein B0H10DRAFT_2047406 [Mycena sp. CBHHK59/15]|nr:hypothetical protein B0H10DRAFT_2047406 [Mycena sp. CBHHK59/15]